MFKVRNENFPSSLKADVVLNCVYKHKQVDMEAQDKGISELHINNIIYLFKTVIRTSKKIRKLINLRREKLTSIHVNALNQYTKRRFQQGFTL